MSTELRSELMDLRTRFERTLLAYEDAADGLEDLQIQPAIRGQARTWLESVVSSLISWSVDIRMDNDSNSKRFSTVEDKALVSVEGSTIADELRSVFAALEAQLRAYLAAIQNHDGEDMGYIDRAIFETVTRAKETLQDFVQPIRMAQATKFGVGPYMGIKNEIDKIYENYVSTGYRVSDGLSDSEDSLAVPESLTAQSTHAQGNAVLHPGEANIPSEERLPYLTAKNSLSSAVSTLPLQAILNCAACIFPTHTQCIYRDAKTNQHTHTILPRTPDVHISHTAEGWSMGVELDDSTKLDDSINLGQGPESARTTYGFSITSYCKIELLEIGTMFQFDSGAEWKWEFLAHSPISDFSISD